MNSRDCFAVFETRESYQTIFENLIQTVVYSEPIEPFFDEEYQTTPGLPCANVHPTTIALQMLDKAIRDHTPVAVKFSDRFKVFDTLNESYTIVDKDRKGAYIDFRKKNQDGTFAFKTLNDLVQALGNYPFMIDDEDGKDHPYVICNSYIYNTGKYIAPASIDVTDDSDNEDYNIEKYFEIEDKLKKIWPRGCVTFVPHEW